MNRQTEHMTKTADSRLLARISPELRVQQQYATCFQGMSCQHADGVLKRWQQPHRPVLVVDAYELIKPR
jgi:hypothetical protein